MSGGRRPLEAFGGCGIELEYMIVDRTTLEVRPIADRVLRGADGRWRNDVGRGAMGWSNELAMHLIEVKNLRPAAALGPLAEAFQAEVGELDRRLRDHGARLMPGGMHPWMDPRRDTRLWSHGHAALYRSYRRIFGCDSHGWLNLQSMHVNLPFADEAQFVRLHDAVRLVLPILPALAASSPFADGRAQRALDYRMVAYWRHQARLPESMGSIVPVRVASSAQYRARVLAPIYRAVAPLDPAGQLRHEWLNARGAIARFERNAIEIRVIDMQECPYADLAVAAATVEAVRYCYLAGAALADPPATATLARILRRCVRDGEAAVIDDPHYLAVLGQGPRACTAGELWRRLLGDLERPELAPWRAALDLILDRGPLARRILRATGSRPQRARLAAVYRELCDALSAGRPWSGES